jgi:CelD/BcsL family acetyltransferase involved in cellulose biosynthesis
VQTQVWHGWSAFHALKDEWNVLSAQSRADCIFLRWEWIEAWRTLHGDAVEPFIVVVRDAHGLAGIGPFYIARSHLVGTVSYRILRILGDLDSGAEYQDWIVRADVEWLATKAIGRAIANEPGWDCVWMPYVADWTGAWTRVETSAHDNNLLTQARETNFGVVHLPVQYAEFFASLSGNTRSMLRRRTKLVHQLPGARFVRCERPEELEVYLNALFELHEKRWRAATSDYAGSFVRRPAMKAFYRAFSRVALEQGWLQLWGIETAGTLAAVQFGYAYNRTFYQLQEGLDPETHDGIGNVLRSHVIESCIQSGIRSYDFLGGYTEHKRRWNAERRSGHRLMLGRQTLKAVILFASRGVWPTGRFLRRSA